MEAYNDGKIISLNDGKVQVKIPNQAVDIVVEPLPLPNIDETPPVPIGFHPFRLVINMKLVESQNHDNEVKSFDPPIEIQVQYTDKDFEIASAVRRDLQLGFWDGTHWVRFTEKKHKFRLVPAVPPNTGGFGVVQITNWDDPTKAWGT